MQEFKDFIPDGVTCLGFGNMSMGLPAYGSCTPAGIMRLLEYYSIEIQGKNAVVVGRSPILGKPMAMMLLNKNATVTICHSRTQNIESIIKQADILVGAVGIPRFIQHEWARPAEMFECLRALFTNFVVSFKKPLTIKIPPKK